MQKSVDGSTLTVVLEKDLTANNTAEFEKKVSTYIAEQEELLELILDLSNTQNIDSVGVTFVISLYKRMQNEGSLFQVVGASEDVQSLFKLMKLDHFFDLEG